jgi:repressor LexA
MMYRSVLPLCFSAKQGQYVAFIYYYTKLHRRPPAEADIRQYFQVSPPSVHQMILTLEARGLIERSPGQPRSIRLRLSRRIARLGIATKKRSCAFFHGPWGRWSIGPSLAQLRQAGTRRR